MPTDIIILAGPGDSAFNRKHILEAKEAFKKIGTNVTCIGNGEDNLTSSDYNKLLKSVGNSNKHIILFIMAHGENIEQNGKLEHCINLTGDFSTRTNGLLDDIAHIGKPIDVFSTACHDGMVNHSAALKLPKNSTYISLSPASEPVDGATVKQLIKCLSSGEISQSDITGEQLGMIYLVKALQYRMPIFISGSQYSLHNKFLSRLGIKFTTEEKNLAYKLEPLASKPNIDAVINQIENATDHNEYHVVAKEFGLALAICHIVSEGKLEQQQRLHLEENYRFSSKYFPMLREKKLNPALTIPSTSKYFPQPSFFSNANKQFHFPAKFTKESLDTRDRTQMHYTVPKVTAVNKFITAPIMPSFNFYKGPIYSPKPYAPQQQLSNRSKLSEEVTVNL